MIKKRVYLALAAIFIFLSFEAKSQATKYQVAYLYNFTNFIEWPQNESTSTFLVGVLGPNAELEKELKNLANTKKIQNKSMDVKVFNSIQEVTACQVIFVSDKQVNNIPQLRSKFTSKNILIISDAPNAIEKGAVICFVLNDGKLHFRLSQENAAVHGLKISSRLVELALK